VFNRLVPLPCDVYFSADVESDGPIPGVYSMLSFGLAAAATYDGNTFASIDPVKHNFYRELKPISDRFQPNALEATGIDRDILIRTGADPAVAMHEVITWIRETAAALAAEATPVFVAYPLGYDWMFFHWYLIRYAGVSPFGHAYGLDIKTLYAARARATIAASTKTRMPAALRSRRPHTHNALDDAIEQADLFVNIFEWNVHQCGAGAID
jgi:hypothetical protein